MAEEVPGDLVGLRRRWPRNVHVTPYSSSPKIRRSTRPRYSGGAAFGAPFNPPPDAQVGSSMSTVASSPPDWRDLMPSTSSPALE